VTLGDAAAAENSLPRTEMRQTTRGGEFP
jgi:hypothetical protein